MRNCVGGHRGKNRIPAPSRARIVYLGAALVGAFSAQPAVAHERWFVEENVRGEIPQFFRAWGPETAVVALAAIIVVALLVIVDHRRRTAPAHRFFLKLEAWASTILGILVGASLITAALDRTLLAPDLHLPDGVWSTAAVTGELAAGVFLMLGFFARAAALGLLLFWVVALFSFRLAAFDYINLLGIGFFLLVWGRGRFALGSIFGRIFLAMQSAHLKAAALFALRVLTGLTFIILGAEKLARPDLHLRLLELFPSWNPWTALTAIVPGLGRELYLLILAATEISLGAIITLGVFLRVFALVALIPFLLSPIFFGSQELFGHLPTIGALAVLFIFGRRSSV